MSRFHSYLRSSVELLSVYTGREPFSAASKKFFATRKKYGSRDRKTIIHACYCYFRVRHLFRDDEIEDVILKGLFLCGETDPGFFQDLYPAWLDKQNLAADEKLAFLAPGIPVEHIFPLMDEVSEGLDKHAFAISLFQQPDLFIRIRPGYASEVMAKLKQAGLNFTQPAPGCIALPNGSRIDEILALNREAVIQDYSSQQSLEFLEPPQPLNPSTPKLSVWDCCAASGGKSILAKDILGEIELTVSDSRESILHNLKTRFAEAGIKKFRSFVADLSQTLRLQTPAFDYIIADVPCSGSGTWGRTPEQLLYFDRSEIGEYANLQQRILTNVVPALKPGGHLLYITCSVFREENEAQVAFLKTVMGLREIKAELIKGYNRKADTMFASLLEKPL